MTRGRRAVLTDPIVSRMLYASAVVGNLALGAFSVQLAAGAVPLPTGWAWAVPILQAAITGLMMFLPRAGAEDIAAQVDDLKATGVPKRDMVVLSRDEAIERVVDDPTTAKDSDFVLAVADEIEKRRRAAPLHRGQD